MARKASVSMHRLPFEAELRWYWLARDANGKIVANNAGFASKAKAIQDAKSVAKILSVWAASQGSG